MTNWKRFMIYNVSISSVVHLSVSVHCFMGHYSTVSFHAQHFHQRRSEPLASEEVQQNHCERHAKHQKLVFTWWTWSTQQKKSQIFPSGVCGKHKESLYWTDRSANDTTPDKCSCCFLSGVCRTHVLSYLPDRWHFPCCVWSLFLLLSSGQALTNADYNERPVMDIIAWQLNAQEGAAPNQTPFKPPVNVTETAPAASQ